MEISLLVQGIIIAIIQGITEFLPISSTGHMILVGHWIGFEGDFARLYEIVIQLGTILAVPMLFWKRFSSTLRCLWPGQPGFIFWSKIAVACIPAGCLGLLAKDFIDQQLMYPFPVAIALIVGALLILAVEKFITPLQLKRRSQKSLDEITYAQAFGIGLFQCLALWPGFSRSASTIIGGKVMGLNSLIAAEFSFFLAIPMMVLTSGYALYRSEVQMIPEQLLVLGAGFVISFIVALLVINRFVQYLKSKPLSAFAWYRLVVGIGILIFFLTGWL